MTDSSTMDWSEGEIEGQVELPDGRALFLKASGPKRTTPAVPAIVIEHGLGGTASEWVAVQCLVSRFARVYAYERAGYHKSELPIHSLTTEHIAADLRLLLRTAVIKPPYLLIGHSYGGILIRQFLADYPDEVCGTVIIDSAPIVNKYEDVVGLSANRTVTDKEYNIINRESDMNSEIASQESKLQLECSEQLKERLQGKQLLGDRRLSVIFCDESNDFRKVYEYGIEHDYGTPEAQEKLRQHLEEMSAKDEAGMREHLMLSSNSRFVKAEGKRKTHNVHLVDPDFVAKEIRWVLDGQEGQ